jgi:hypothetical protein
MTWFYSPSTGGFYRSGAPQDAIAISDEQYAGLLAGLNSQTKIVEIVDGAPVLANPPAPPPPTKDELLAYAAQKQQAVMDGGLTVNIAVAGQPAIAVQCTTKEKYLMLLNGAVQRSGLNSAAVLNWEQRDGSVVTLNAAETQALGLAVANWLQSIFDLRTQTLAPAVVAGTITTFAEIDDPTSVHLPAWPANS